MRSILVATALALFCPLVALAQVHQIAYTLEGDPPPFASAQEPIDHSVAVSQNRVIVATINRLQIYGRSGGTPLDDCEPSDPNFPFDAVAATTGRIFFDPRVEYDPIHDRFWLVYSEDAPPPSPSEPRPSYLHIAISKSNAPNGFNATDWHLFTGPSTATKPAFNFQHGDIEPETLRFGGRVDHPTINVTGDYLYMIARDVDNLPDPVSDFFVAFPLSHGGGSMLSGARPSEGDLKILRFLDPAIADDGHLHYLVQDPHQEDPGVQLILCTPESPTAAGVFAYTGVQDGIRLGGVWVDTLGNLQYKWVDMPMPSDSFYYFNPEVAGYRVDTPDSNWEIGTILSKFDSGVLAMTVNNQLRLFTAHHVLFADVDGPPPHTPIDRQELRWYVINPDLDDFFTSWSPSIETVGTAPAGPVEETYHGNIAVNALGAAYITFTRSGPAAWPSLYYARLSTDYSAVQFTNQLQQGPAQRWIDTTSWWITVLSADYTDLQWDPVGCGFISLAALVDCNDCASPTPPTYSDFRAIWLTEIPVDCNNAEMNGDGVVDAADLAIYLDHYAMQEPQADMDGDESVGTVDYQIYSDEYAKR